MNINNARTIFWGFFLTWILASSLRGLSQSFHNPPTFQLNHIDICIDSVSFNAISKSDFLRDSFAFIKIFTDSTGSEIIMSGKETFIHLLPQKGFYENRLGATLLVHHSFQHQETESILKHLQAFTTDSLYIRPYNSKMNIDYINVYENPEEKDNLMKFIPIMQNWSTDDYLSWGYTEDDLRNGITQKRFMTDYVGKETDDKLFRSIEKITVAVTDTEKSRVGYLLAGYGYHRKGDAYSLLGNPSVYLIDIRNNIRTVQVVMSLSKQVARQQIFISDNAVLTLVNNMAILNYTVRENYR